MISAEAWPRMQRKPWLSGLSGSPRTPTRRPSSTSASMPQRVGWQFIGHMVRTTCRLMVLPSTYGSGATVAAATRRHAWACSLVSLHDARGRTPEHAAREGAGVGAGVDHEHAVDDDMRDTGRILPRLLEGGAVRDRGGIEHRDIGGVAGPEHPAVLETERDCGPAGHLVHRLRQREQPEVARVMAEDAREGAIEARMRQIAGERATGPDRPSVGADEHPRAGDERA